MAKNSHGKTNASGKGGETHQQADKPLNTLTTQQGAPIADDQNSLRAGARGPILLEDQILRDKIFHFDHERIPERVVHARGFGVHGFFQNYNSLADITHADVFQREGEKVPAFVRFSTVAGNKGSFDLARDVRGFAVKLYTREGNWDIVGNNMPVFFIQDAIKFPDLIHAVKDEPDSGFPQAQSAHDNFWDFISLMPESMHMIMWIMSDRAIPRSFRFMEGFGVHTFRMINSKGESTFVKFHWKPKLGMQSVMWNEAVKINGADPDFHRRDLWNAIKVGDFPEWELGLQVFDEQFAAKFAFDVLDATKLIPEEEVPIRIVGRLVLDRVVDNFFAETEQVAFCTQNIVPASIFRMTHCCKAATFRISTLSSSVWVAPISRIFQSMRRSVRCIIFSRTATWQCVIRRAGPTTNPIPGVPKAGHVKTRQEVLPLTRRKSKDRKCACARKPSQTITARRACFT
jgi:catalase